MPRKLSSGCVRERIRCSFNITNSSPSRTATFFRHIRPSFPSHIPFPMHRRLHCPGLHVRSCKLQTSRLQQVPHNVVHKHSEMQMAVDSLEELEPSYHTFILQRISHSRVRVFISNNASTFCFRQPTRRRASACGCRITPQDTSHSIPDTYSSYVACRRRFLLKPRIMKNA